MMQLLPLALDRIVKVVELGADAAHLFFEIHKVKHFSLSLSSDV